MFQAKQYPENEEERWRLVMAQFRSLLEPASDMIANMANTSALLFHAMPDLNWVGFYRMQGDFLELGPFQGLPACIRLSLDKGVCAKAAATGKVVCVPDVHAFEGHIACDSASQSELVVPLKKNGKVIGVLDLDSPLQGRFTEADQKYVSEIAASLSEMVC